MKVVPQKKIENSREYTQRALAVAESGLALTTYKLRTDTPPAPGGITDVLQNSSSHSYNSGVVPYNSGAGSGNDSAYQVVIKPASSGYIFYSLGTVGPTLAPLARQAVSVQYSADFGFGDYALYSEKKIDLQNGTLNGSVYSNLVKIQNGTVNGTAYYTDPTSSWPSGTTTRLVANVSFPTIDIAKYKDLWIAFVTGSAPYNGSDTNYPNTSISPLKPFITQYFPTTGPASESSIDNFWTAMAGNSLAAVTLRSPEYREKLVFYIEPGKLNSNPYTSAPFLEGTIIVKGDLDLTGGAVIGDPARPSKTALLMEDGAVTVGAGGATINGFLYIAGTAKHGNDPMLSCKATGGLTVNGSIVANGTISAGSNGLEVTWKPNDVYQDMQKGVPPLNAVPSSWRQISYDAFLIATQP